MIKLMQSSTDFTWIGFEEEVNQALKALPRTASGTGEVASGLNYGFLNLKNCNHFRGNSFFFYIILLLLLFLKYK
jgi:hypothetical protein